MPTYSIMYVPQHKRIVRSSSDIVISIVVEHQLVINRLYTCSLPNCTRCGVLIDRQGLISYQYLPDLPGNTIEYLPTIIPCISYLLAIIFTILECIVSNLIVTLHNFLLCSSKVVWLSTLDFLHATRM